MVCLTSEAPEEQASQERGEKSTLQVLSNQRSTWNHYLDVGKVVFDHLFEVSFHFISQDVVLSLWVVCFAVVPDQLNVVEHFFDGPVLSSFESLLDFEEVHGVLHQERVVIELEF